jgi:nucleoid-associated protein YgaU
VLALTPRSAAAGTTLDRAYLEIVKPEVSDAERIIPLRFNPAEYQLKKSQTLAEIAIPGLVSPPLQWVRGGAEVLSFEALVDTTDTLRDVDQAYVSGIRTLLDSNEQLHAPPILAFVWGRRRFVGVLEGLSIAYTLFDEEGHPLRAKLSISLKEYRPAAVQMIEHPRSSPDVEKTYLVRCGDTLPSIASAVFRDPARWRELALANGLRDPRDLRPGDRLHVPRLR